MYDMGMLMFPPLDTFFLTQELLGLRGCSEVEPLPETLVSSVLEKFWSNEKWDVSTIFQAVI